ncbi:ABC transporter substrate-binding protein [Burkholderia multivorans]|uniref:ABC transporter substrate-binding protein n=1 Tax=Burkholderia multivorans TaxID=87883 RepID=UPI0020B1B17D|nr:ABC transporter substrate-binding protein [Burkholderia multivorans]
MPRPAAATIVVTSIAGVFFAAYNPTRKGASQMHLHNARRRALLKAGAAVGVTGLVGPVLAAAPRQVSITLPWLAQGATSYVYVAAAQGMFKKRGIDATITRGYGSLTAGQAVGAGKFDFGLVSASSTLVCAANGIPLSALATTNYEAYLGILVRAGSGIRTPKDLEGKRLGCVPSSVEFPFWNVFASKAGIDESKVTKVQVDPRVLERLLVQQQVDACYCVVSTSYAVAKGMGVDTRAMLLSHYGVSFYSNNIVTRPDRLARDPQLCEAVTDALLEALAFVARDPEAGVDILVKSVPEIGLTKGGRENARLSQGFMLASLPYPEAIDHGLGYSDPKRLDEMNDLVMRYAVAGKAKRPDTGTLFTNRFIGQSRLSAAEWASVRQQNAQYPKLIGT